MDICGVPILVTLPKQKYRYLIKLDRKSNISQSMPIYDIDNFDIIIRKAVYNFRERWMKSQNTVSGAIINYMFFSMYHYTQKVV